MRRLVLAIAALVVALAAAEIVLRTCFSTKLYYTWPPNLRKVFNPDPALLPGISGDSRFDIDSDGIRGDEMPRGDTYRILAVGGSTTECLYLDQEEAWPRLLERKLNALGKRPTWIGNVGKSGLRTREHVVQVELLLDQYPRIDAVLMLVGQNDFMTVLTSQEHFDTKFMSRPDAKALLIKRTFYRVRDPEKEHGLALWYFLRDAFSTATMPAPDPDDVLDDVGHSVQRWREQRQRSTILEQLPDLSLGLADTQRNLEVILDTVAARKKRIVLVTQPSLWRKDLTDKEKALLQSGAKGLRKDATEYYSVAALERGIAEFNRLLQSVAQRRGVECIDLAALLPRDASLFYDDVHFNESGSTKVADILFDELRKSAPYGGR